MLDDTSAVRGRPTLPAGERKSADFKFRLRPALRAKVIPAAQNSGRSVSEEIERRLEDSFGPNESMKAAIREIMRESGERRGSVIYHHGSSPEASEAVRRAAERAVKGLLS